MRRALLVVVPLLLFGLSVGAKNLKAQVLDISTGGSSHSRFVWDTSVKASTTSINTPRNGNSDLIFDQFDNDVQWGESWFLQGDFGAGLQNIELLNGAVINDGDNGTVTFGNIENTGIDVHLQYGISDGPDGHPFMTYQATVANNGANGFAGSLINYFDYHLGTLADDSGQSLHAGNLLRTYDNQLPFQEVLRETSTPVTHWELGLFDVSSVPYQGLYFELTDTVNPKLTLLDANSVASNLNNITAAQQWDLNLAAGFSTTIDGTIDVNLTAVPEPASAFLLAGVMGSLCLMRRRRDTNRVRS